MKIASADSCLVEGGDITWGFKESFRSYISGSIANGEWTVAEGATYETPSFGFSGASGTYNPASAAGRLDFTGAITFTGHGGVLNTTVANPSIRLDDAKTAYLLLDVTGTTQEGKPVSTKAVEFARLDLSVATIRRDASRVTMTDVPAELTTDGSVAFGTYGPGEALDPVTLSFTTPDCDLKPLPIDWLPWALASLGAIAAVISVLVFVRRRTARVTSL